MTLFLLFVTAALTLQLQAATTQLQTPATAQIPAAEQRASPPGPLSRKSPPMPTQKQSLDYFAGTWTFERLGAESAVAPGPSAGRVTFTATPSGALQGLTEATLEGGGDYRESATISFNAETKTLAWSEQRPKGVTFVGTGDWSSPIAIRFALQPITIDNHTFQIRRVISIISASSFRMTEEVSVDDGPFKRLGNALYTKK